MSSLRVVVVTILAMLAFAGNSLLCRMALARTDMDAATFTSIRVLSGAIVLTLLLQFQVGNRRPGGSWISAAALFCYAACFSFAYLSLPTGTGALLLFGAVQATMMGWALVKGERLRLRQISGLILAMGGLVVLLFPGIRAPSPMGAVLMLSAGAAWGIYSLRGAGKSRALNETAGNFLRAVPFCVLVNLILIGESTVDMKGVLMAVLSGALASGMGYALWYSVLPYLRSSTAATVQLSVPSLAAVGGVLFLGEPLTIRLVLAAAISFAGVLLFSLSRVSSNSN